MFTKLCLGLAIVAMTLSAGAVMAGDYHFSTELICSDCHTMHYSVSHNYDNGDPAPDLGAGGPFARLLKDEANAMCLECHDAKSFAPDVSGANTGTHVRQGGALTTGTTPYEDWKGHTLGSMAVAPGGTFSATDGLKCITCHSQHGRTSNITNYPAGYTNGQWRNLQGKPAGVTTSLPVTYAKGTNDATLDIFEHDATLGQIATHYSVDNVDFNEPDATKSGYAAWCQSCHTNFHGASADANMNDGSDWVRHPTADVNISGSSLTQYKSHTNKVKVLTGTAADDYSPSCFSCHKAHGNQRAFGLIYMSGTGTVNEQGDTDAVSIRDMCRQCHTRGA